MRPSSGLCALFPLCPFCYRLLTHESRRLSPWLICDVSQRDKLANRLSWPRIPVCLPPKRSAAALSRPGSRSSPPTRRPWRTWTSSAKHGYWLASTEENAAHYVVRRETAIQQVTTQGVNPLRLGVHPTLQFPYPA